ncbi:spore coat associated protein CotJA [Paenibacillus alvei]|uniref:Spore coat associated protein CotJA n=1 Tax=Paenibacillus alvei TaxID=44250 RepID=A0AAP7A0X9_PAEAL|nr:spore coat associated protein CotJA [Paenibacillus alvei]EJW17548.1 spore coat associated protein JA [Paenibacillus alvei DSM 29]NEZ40743.1 spore coat associated protein CotJA [Paenibacillus alvei]NOJ70813.1 spore coat associated protein CotJA [Paenibacillus alvei]
MEHELQRNLASRELPPVEQQARNSCCPTEQAIPQDRVYVPFRSPCDPCPPLPYSVYVVPINQFITFQPPNLPQFPPEQALRCGTLWPALYSPYHSRRTQRGEGEL